MKFKSEFNLINAKMPFGYMYICLGSTVMVMMVHCAVAKATIKDFALMGAKDVLFCHSSNDKVQLSVFYSECHLRVWLEPLSLKPFKNPPCVCSYFFTFLAFPYAPRVLVS